MGKYRVKPQDVEAEKFGSHRDLERIKRWLGPHLLKTEPSVRDPRDVAVYVFDIRAKEWIHVPPMFYIIKDSDGALSVLSVAIFEAKWEPVPATGVSPFPVLPGVVPYPHPQPIVTYGGDSGNR